MGSPNSYIEGTRLLSAFYVQPFTGGSCRTATMASADFCPNTDRVTPECATVLSSCSLALGDETRAPGLLNQWPNWVLSRSPVGQTSPDKDMNFQRTAAAFTVSLKPEGFVTIGSLAHETQPCMRFLFVGSRLCARASSAQPLTGLHLPSASSYHRWAYSAPDPMLVYLQGTCTPLVHAHAGRTNKFQQTAFGSC